MARIGQSRPATQDLLTIWEYIARDDPASASGMLRKIDEAVQLLAANPLMGEDESRLRAGLRLFVVGSYVIFYKPTDAGILVIRVLHGARRYEDIL